MKKEKILSYLIVLVMIATLMTACGKKEESPEPTTESVETTETLETEKVVEKKTELSGLDKGINITGEFGTAADAVIESVEDNTESEIKALVSNDLGVDISATESYDITIVDENGIVMQPEGTVTVTISISDKMNAAEGDTYAVYYYNPEKATVENIECKTANNTIVFDTTHFSIYAIIKYTNEPVIDETEEPSETEPSETEPSETEPLETELSGTELSETSEPASIENAELPGKNRNGRYPDIPESVLPSSEAIYCDFFDNPIQVTTWDDVTGTIYADYARTQII